MHHRHTLLAKKVIILSLCHQPALFSLICVRNDLFDMIIFFSEYQFVVVVFKVCYEATPSGAVITYKADIG